MARYIIIFLQLFPGSSRMSLVTDDLDVKYGVMNQNDVADKKKRKKSKGRTLEIEFPLHSNGLIQWVAVILICMETAEFFLFI